MHLNSPGTEYEDRLRAQGYKVIAGVDEAGRGPLAGPVVAVAVTLPEGYALPGIQDSKRLTSKARERLYNSLVSEVRYAVGIRSPEEIDRLNILRATHDAMRDAVHTLVPRPEHVLVDGLRVANLDWEHTAVIGGDRLSISIAAASIIAKVIRDRIMIELDQRFPEYGFARHKGYATREHLCALERLGPCPVHRFSFAPVRRCCRPEHRALVATRLGQLNLRVEA